MPALPASRRWLARAAVLLAVLALLAPAAASAVTYQPDDSPFEVGTMTQPAEGVTVVAVQGFHFQGKGATKKPARLVAFGPRGGVRWVYNGSSVGARWFYDVDPLPDGNLLVTATNPDGTIVMALDPDTREPIWIERFDFHDTHDVDLINGDQLLIANMRNYDETTGRNNDRVLVYDRGTGEVVWEWMIRKHGYPREGGGKYTGDWTHVNDVDEIGEGRYLVSIRNFDQVVVVDRSTKEVTLRLGADERHRVLYEQHNPMYLESEGGRPTILVADSERDRIVEYEKRGGNWTRTWMLTGGLSWPRDADRLPDGNTLIVDSLNHRVIEVTPRGRIVWEVYVPWGPYDVERVRLGDEAGAVDDLPTTADLGKTGRHELSGSAGLAPGTGKRTTFAGQLTALFVGTPLQAEARWFANRWEHVTPWIYPVWMTGWDFAAVVAAGLLLAGWGAVEAILGRRRIAGFVRRQVAAFRRRVP